MSYVDVEFWIDHNDPTDCVAPGRYAHESILRGMRDALRESAKQHRQRGDRAHATMCDIWADTATEGDID